MDDLIDDMRRICSEHGSEFVMTSPDAIAGVADNVRAAAWPLNGLRYRPGTTSGWFIWAGEQTSQASDFFKPTHIKHLVERCPDVMPYLALAPGYRFLIAPGYEDVWIDLELLEHEV